MARMIPVVVDPETRSPGELDLFVRLRDDPGTVGWVVLHSMDVPRHRTQVVGEVDFVVIVPGLGVLCVEVKAHRSVRRTPGGMWQLGTDSPTARSPFRQSSESMHSVRDHLISKRPSLSAVLFWSCVCFTSVAFTAESDEWHSWQVIDGPALRSRPISSLIRGVLSMAAERVTAAPTGRWYSAARREPTSVQVEQIVSALRPEFEFFESPKARRKNREEQLRRFTEEQFVALDAMESNPRVVFAGPAGTGKTLLAIETVRRAAAAGERVLFLCYNRLLGGWLKHEVEPLGEAVEVGTIHSFMIKASGLRYEEGSPEDFWDHGLPDAALSVLLDDGAEPFGVVVVDETQDLLKTPYLDVVDAALSGGLASGCWRWFGDFERQALFSSGGAPLLDTLAMRAPGTPTYRLTVNCRNPPRIATFVELVAGVESFQRVLRPDNGVEPELRFYEDASAAPAALEAVLRALCLEGFEGPEITILSRYTPGTAARVQSPEWRNRIHHPESARGSDLRACTIHAFKGLESAVVVVTDIDSVGTEEDDCLLYVAITRATERLVVLAPVSLKAPFKDALLSRRARRGAVAT